MAEPLDEQLSRALSEGIVETCLAAEKVAGLPTGVLLAIAAHETGIRNEPAEGRRGVFGIDEGRHADWLRQQRSPTVTDSAPFVAGLVSGAQAFGHANGVDDSQLLKFAISAYRVGPGAALAGYREGDSDRETPGGSYAADVLARLPSIERWLRARVRDGSRPTLEPGATGNDVVELKRLLRDWYSSRGQPPPRRMRGPVYGTAAVDAVKEFQAANGLRADGIVGSETWNLLMGQQDSGRAA